MEERLELLKRQNKMLSCLSDLPARMLQIHGEENVTEFVLHDLCHEECFNLSKVAFFVDNPDFNCTKGIAGYSRQEAPHDETAVDETAWDNPRKFTAHMKNSPFNQKVRSLERCSLKKGNDDHTELAVLLAKDLGFNNHKYCSLPIRYNNQGFVLYEKANPQDDFADDYIVNGLSFLSFCPIY